jgi:SAM-dependent methyltransferase
MIHCGCRFCGTELKYKFADLGMSPLANAYLNEDQLYKMEPYYPLSAYVCEKCFLVQLHMYEPPHNIFTDYAYFSSFSETWMQHCSTYSKMIVERFGIDQSSMVVEIGSNDGYLLQYFVRRGIPVLGIDPARNIYRTAEERGVPTLVEFFNRNLAIHLVQERRYADLIIGNNVLAHVPELNDFISGMSVLLKPDGIITMEFPHLMQLIEKNQFDTIYHEHYPYFSFTTVEKIFNKQGLKIFDVEELRTHGGSIRIYATHSNGSVHVTTGRVAELKNREDRFGLNNMQTYTGYKDNVDKTKRRLLEFIIALKSHSNTLVGYGAPAKGNTLLNYCGIGTDMLDYTVDISPYKQGLYLPGTHIPIYHPEKLRETKPDYVLILAWNLKEEIMKQISYISDWNGKCIIPIPEITVYEDIN